MNTNRLINMIMRYAMRMGMRHFAKRQGNTKQGQAMKATRQAMRMSRNIRRM